MTGTSADSSPNSLGLWVLPNVLGIIAYLYFSSWTWVPQGEPAGGPGDPIIWTLSAFPVMAACFILNVIWIVRILASRGKGRRAALVWLLVIIAWYSVHRYDAYREAPSSVAEDAADQPAKS